MIQKPLLLFIFCMLGITSFLQTPATEEGILIESANYKFEFVFNKKRNKVEVIENQTINYLTTKDIKQIDIGETYDDNLTINDVDVIVDGSRNKYITPKYDFLSQDDIFFSDQHICYFSIPVAKKGQRSKVIFNKTHLDPRYFCQLYLIEDYPTLTKKVEIIIPNWLDVDFKEFNFKGYAIDKQQTSSKNGDESIITYTATLVNVPKKERQAPGPTYYVPHLLTQLKKANLPNGETETFFNTVADQYAWYRTVLSGLENDKVVLRQKAQEIASSKTSDLDKIKAIFYWVQNNIRYLAFENGIAGFRPDKANEVLRKKYGDCKGMANLTKELLVALGYDARLCWIGTNHIAHDYSTPSLSVDNHMICALNFGGKVYYLDATEKHTALEEYAERIQSRQVLYENKDKFVLANVPTTSISQNKDYEKRILTIEGTNLVGTAEHQWSGEEKSYLLYQITNTKKDNVTDALRKFLTNNNPDYVISNTTTSNLDDYDKNLWAKYNVTYNNGLTQFGKELYIDVDFRKNFNDFIIDTSKRKLDYWLTFKSIMEQETEIALPAGATLKSVPANLSINNQYVTINATYTVAKNKLNYKKTIQLKNPRIKKADFSSLNADMKKLTEFYQEQVVVLLN